MIAINAPLFRRLMSAEPALPSATDLPIAAGMDVSDLRVAIVSGNYNCIRDGANQALNRFADYLLRHGAKVRAYSPTVAEPAFEAKGDLVHVPSVPIPGRSEYKFAFSIPPRVQRDLAAFYLLGYSSTNETRDGKFRRITVRVNRPDLQDEMSEARHG